MFQINTLPPFSGLMSKPGKQQAVCHLLVIFTRLHNITAMRTKKSNFKAVFSSYEIVVFRILDGGGGSKVK
jgi:hypothetical protein